MQYVICNLHWHDGTTARTGCLFRVVSVNWQYGNLLYNLLCFLSHISMTRFLVPELNFERSSFVYVTISLEIRFQDSSGGEILL